MPTQRPTDDAETTTVVAARPTPLAYLLSFIRAPIGFIVNLIATIMVHMPPMLQSPVVDQVVIVLCEVFCVQDGVQDDVLF